ncbi:MAG TPA: vitamin K epoxide reductase family protein [Flavisolibacter sp.]|nr:vitamin K epoxide reductase family protein [Flavisolibacter sp.]
MKTFVMNATAIRDAMRNESSEALDKRRKIIALSALGLVDFSIISLYQTGIIRHMPDIPHPLFDSDKVNASEDAYRFGAPDGPISTVAYAVAMVLASAGGSEKAERTPVFDVALGATVGGNALGAIFYLHKMIFVQKKVCLYCVTGAAINIASAVIAAPLFLKGFKKLFGSKT